MPLSSASALPRFSSGEKSPRKLRPQDTRRVSLRRTGANPQATDVQLCAQPGGPDLLAGPQLRMGTTGRAAHTWLESWPQTTGAPEDGQGRWMSRWGASRRGCRPQPGPWKGFPRKAWSWTRVSLLNPQCLEGHLIIAKLNRNGLNSQKGESC